MTTLYFKPKLWWFRKCRKMKTWLSLSFVFLKFLKYVFPLLFHFSLLNWKFYRTLCLEAILPLGDKFAPILYLLINSFLLILSWLRKRNNDTLIKLHHIYEDNNFILIWTNFKMNEKFKNINIS